jgi:hypothetical protein
MGKRLRLRVKEKAQIVFKIKDGRTSIVDGVIFSRNKKSFLVKVFKRIIFSIDEKKYDLVEFASSTIRIFKKDIQKMNPINRNFNIAIEGIDDGEY